MDDSHEIIAVLGVRREITPILRRMDVTEIKRVGMARYHSGALNGRLVVAVEMGVGKVNAAAATQSLIDRYRPRYAIFTGSAGALTSDLDVGDLVIADRVAVHDTGIQRREGFVPTGFMTLSDTAEHTHAHRMYADPELVALAHRVAEGMSWSSAPDGRAPRVHIGTVATGDQIILSDEKRHWLLDTFGALVVEMEGAAFAQVASANALPWLVIRSVSDHANHHFDFAFELWQEYVDAPQTAKARIGRAIDRLAYMLRDPQAVLRARRLRDNLAYAAGNAARLTEAVVEAL